jgi:hypothetical protein
MQLIKAIAAFTVLATGAVSAATVITGKFTVTKPEFTIVNKSGDLVSSVKEATFAAEQFITDQYCSVTTDKDIALEGGTIESGNCLFEWTAPSSFTADRFSLKGTYPTAGDVSIGYTLSYYSGSDKTKTLIDSKTISARFVDPAKPIVSYFDLKLGGRWKEQGNHTNYNPNDYLTAIRVNVQVRDLYNQAVSIEGLGACIVEIGTSSCEISFPEIKLGDIQSNKVGQLNYTAYLNTEDKYWSEDQASRVDIDVPWSYLPSKINNFSYNSMPRGYEQEKSIVVNTESISVANNTAKLVISKPSDGIDGDWWAPDFIDFKFLKNDQPVLSEGVEHDGNVLYSKNLSLSSSIQSLTSRSKVKLGNHYIYTFDLNQIEDGFYDINTSFTNSVNVTTTASFSDIRVNKIMPEIDVFKGMKKLSNGDSFTFIQELVVGTFNSYDKNVDLVSVSINGNPVNLNTIKTGVAVLEPSLSITKGNNEFVITVKDSRNNTYKKTIMLRHEPMNIAFNIETTPSVLVSKIREVTLNAVQSEFSNYCSVTTNEQDAIGSSVAHTNLCYFEWVGMNELSRDELTLKGVLAEPGSTPVAYKLYTYFGGEKEKTEIASKTFLFEVENPKPPALSSYSVLVDDEWINDNEKKVHNPKSMVYGIRINTEEVNYAQKVTMPDFGACVINTGESSCTIGVTPFYLGDLDFREHEIGEKAYPVKVNSTNNYWELEEVQSDINIRWEYVDAKVESFAVNGRSETSTNDHLFSVNGKDIVIENNTAIVVVNKPINNVPGTWWLPSGLELKFITSGGQQTLSRLALDENTLFRNRFANSAEATLINRFTGPEVINDKYVYKFNIENVPDGRYSVEVNAIYSYGANDVTIFDKAAVISRFEPQIGVFRGYTKLENNEEFYFDSELAVAAFNGYVNGVEITSVKAGGQSLIMNDVSDGIVRVKGLSEKLEPAESVTIDVEVTDSYGDTFNYSIPIIYAPLSFKLKLRNDEHTPYRAIEMIEIESEQTAGEACRFYSERDIAIKYARPGRNSCLFLWENLPDTFEVSSRSRSPSAVGYLNETSFEVSNKIEVINENGDSVIINGDTLLITPQEPTSIEVKPSSRSELIQGYYPIEISGGEVVRMETKSSKGSIDMNFEMNSAVENLVRHPSSRTGEIFRTTGTLDLPHDVGVNLWDVVPVNFSAKYEKLPNLKTTKTINAVVIPDSSIGLDLDFQDDLILTTDQVTAKVQLGKYNRIDGWNYDKSSMGEWEVYIGRYNRREIPEPISETVKLDEFGRAVLEMPMEEIGEESGTFVAVAKTVNVPIPNHEMHIQSSRTHFIVFKGTKIEGDLRDGQIRGRVPLRASANYVPEDRADSGSLGEVIWEKSEDGLSWVEDEEFRNTLRWRKTLDTEQVKYLRVKVENKFTNEWAITEPLKIVAYTQPDLRVEQTTEVLFNEAATFAVYDYETKVNSGDGVIEWSTDNRKTWFSGSAEESFYKDDFSGRDLNVRMKYHGIASDESLGDEAFREARTRYTYLRSPRFYFDIEAPELVEVGTTHTLKATVTTRIESLNSRVESEWVLPNGQVISDAEMELTFDKSMLDGRYYIITHQAWVEGSKEETIQSTRFRIESWEYEFPELELNMPATVNYMPSKMRANVEVARHFAPGVEYTFDIIDKTGINILEQTDGNFVLQFDEVGMKNITFKVSNDRGQSKTISQIVEVLPRTPLEIEIVKTFSNDFLRYPLDVSLRTRVRLSHPDDRVINYKWFLDGEFYLETRRYRESIADMAVGGHNVKVEVETEFGQTGTQDFDVTVIPNTKPTGTIKMLETDLYYELHLNCEDADGRILATTWEINGETLTHSHNVIQFNKSKLTGTSFVIGRCYDDSYDYTEVPQTLN